MQANELLKFFWYGQQPESLQEVCKKFYDAAEVVSTYSTVDATLTKVEDLLSWADILPEGFLKEACFYRLVDCEIAVGRGDPLEKATMYLLEARDWAIRAIVHQRQTELDKQP